MQIFYKQLIASILRVILRSASKCYSLLTVIAANDPVIFRKLFVHKKKVNGLFGISKLFAPEECFFCVLISLNKIKCKSSIHK